MKLSELLTKRRATAARAAKLASEAEAASKDLEVLDAELFARLQNLVSAIEGGEPSDAIADTAEQLDGTSVDNLAKAFTDRLTKFPTWGALPRLAKRSAGRRPSPLEVHFVSVLREAGKPMTRNEIFDEMVKRGVDIPGKNPKSNLSAHLSYSNAVMRDANGTWALKQGEIAL